MSDTKNAVIRSVMLGREDHGIPTAMIGLDYGDSCQQGFGGWGLAGPAMSVFVLGVLDALEVETWEKLVGVSCRVEATYSNVARIGHLLKDKWFDPEEAFRPLRDAALTNEARS